MDVRNCKNCGRLFNYLSGPSVCPLCRAEVDKKFADVKEYVRNNPGSTIHMVAEENDVSVQQIRQWVKEERLEFSANSTVGIECENCGANIRTGRFCSSCKSKLQNEMQGVLGRGVAQPASADRKRDGSRMRFLD